MVAVPACRGCGARSARRTPGVVGAPAAGSSPARIRAPGTRSAAAATSPAGMAIRWSGSALRRARPRLRRPSPASATTMAAPTRQQAYTATVRSIPGRMRSATRCPGRTPARSSPTASSAIRSFEVGEADRRGGVRPELGDRDLVVVRPGEQTVPERSIGLAGVGVWRVPGRGRRRSAARRPPRPAPTPRRPSRPEVRPPPPGARPAGRAGRPRGGAGDGDRAGSGSRRPDPAGPHTSSAGRSARSARPSTTPSRVARLGWPDSSGMSATKSRTARRRTGSAYGLANASRTAFGRAGRESAVVARTNAGVRAQTVSSRGPDRASVIRPGGAVSAGRETPVLVSTMPASSSRCRSAQPSSTGPPQSWATATTGPDTSSASVSRPRSSIRSASVRGRSRRSDQPMPSWSGAMTRQPGGAAARNRRHR